MLDNPSRSRDAGPVRLCEGSVQESHDNRVVAAELADAPTGTPERRPSRGDPRLAAHILPTAGTMVGVCTTLIGLVKIAEVAGAGPSIVDESYGFAALVFLVSALASYFSMRLAPEDPRGPFYERLADRCFIVGLVGLATISMLFAYETI